ncbi:2-oxo acid dehydrogenase subunit E2 [Streptomyces sp. NPDC057137]|uniref:2-oxo acid dehydrogenase subunit E2 n=1 Tax=Streptomyces sp. NPDC057137 TaxID=3346030 RepID=UPI003630F0EB
MASPDDVTLVPHTTIRRRIARHMTASSRAAPHAYATVDVDYSAVDTVRRIHAARWRQEHGYSLTYLPFAARAVATGIGQYPQLNARYTDDGLELRSSVGLGVAVDMNFEGLIVPVVQRADTLDVPAFAREINALAGRTRSGELRGGDVAGGTFTLSNPGPFGARTTLPIINQPQVAIITVDAIAPRPAVVPDGEGGHTLTVRPIGNLTLAWDHRAFDGAYAASALGAIRTALESHDWRTEFTSWAPLAQTESAITSPAA